MKQYSKKQVEFISKQFNQGQKAIEAGLLKQAEKAYLEILKIDDSILEARNALAFLYTISKQHSKAISQLQAILKHDPDNINAHYNLANNLQEEMLYDEAIIHYKNTITLNPDFVDAYIQLAKSQRALKLYDLAIENLQKAQKLDKFNAKAFHGLGITYALIEEYPYAIECLQKAIALAPNNHEFHFCLAKILEDADHVHEADIQYHFTCSKYPDYLEAFLAYGDLLFKKRYYDQAFECYSRAHQISMNDPDILIKIGNTYLNINDTDNAIRTFESARQIDPKCLSSLTGLTQAYQEAGKLDSALDTCNQIIAIDENQPHGFLLKSTVRKSKADDGLAERLLSFLNRDDLDESMKISINHALGKIYDDQHKYEQAFTHYATANQLKQTSDPYNANKTKSLFDNLIEVFNADYFNQHQDIDNNNIAPIFIIGMPRSGTTLTEQIISSHPEVSAAGEVRYWSDVVRAMPYVLKSELEYPHCLKQISPDYIKNITDNYISTLERITGSHGEAKHYTDKMPHNFLNIGLIASMFPKAKIIHTVRDPLDTCLSIYFQNFSDSHSYAYDLSNLGNYYKQYERLMQHWDSVLPNRIFKINYADLVSDPTYWTERLISHLNLDWNDACLTPHKLERTVRTASHWQVRQPIYKTSIQRWKNYENYIQPLINALSLNDNN